MYKKRTSGTIGAIITIIVLIVLVITTNIDVSKFSVAEDIANKVVMPIQNGLIYIKNKIAKNNSFFESVENLKIINEELEEKNQELEKKLGELEIIKAENKTLREYANLTENYTSYDTVPAYIINKDISNLSKIIVINVGVDNGVTEGLAVVSKEGLVGYVISATKNTAKVQTIVDASNNVSANLAIANESIILKGILGNSKELKATYIQPDTDIIIGDRVQTSGLGGIYPKGLAIGTVKEIVETKNISDRYAIIELAVDFSKLENVLVIKNKNL